MGIKYHAHGEPETTPNGSLCFYTAGPFRSVAKVERCPCEDGLARTAYATAEPDTFFTIPAMVSVKHKTVSGELEADETGWHFIARRSGKNTALLVSPSTQLDHKSPANC